MSNIEYIRSMIRDNDRIYIDTSTLMDVEKLETFLEQAAPIMAEENKTICVPQEVCMELVKHLGGDDDRKKNLVLRIFELFKKYKSLFKVEKDEIRNADVKNAFADPKLLAELTENRASYRQLLISNDKNLSEDAFSLNNLSSCHGFQIRVCYLNRYGELHRCECAKKKDVENVQKIMEPIHQEIALEPQKEPKEDRQESKPWYEGILPLAGMLTVGIAIGGVGREICQYFKKAL